MDFDEILEQLAQVLTARRLRLVTAESCTGGGVAQTITALAGSSDWFDRGWVTYSNAAKAEQLGIDPVLIETRGAVSAVVAREMARGAIRNSAPDRVALSVTGIAGPGGGSVQKPVGLVHMAWKHRGNELQREFRFQGDRQSIRQQSIQAALQGVLDLLDAHSD